MFLQKPDVIAMFEEELDAWNSLLSGLSAEELTTRWLPSGWSIKDTLAHLRAWQQRTIARLEGTLEGHEPRFPQWPVEVDEEETLAIVERANAWILEANRDRPWDDVHREWRDGFLRFLELIRQIPEADLRPGGRLAWMAEYEPSEFLPGALDTHHSEHRGLLLAWLRARGASESAPNSAR